MNDLSPENITLIRFGIFWGVLVVLIIIERLKPWRYVRDDWQRFGGNLGLVLLSALMLRWCFPLLAVGVAHLATVNEIGLLHWLSPSGVWRWLSLALIYLLLDMAIYCQHRLFHVVPLFWRAHRVHHTDEHLDASSALRFHPLEIAASMVFKFGIILVLGAPVWLVIIFEVMLNGIAMFNHSNIRINKRFEPYLRAMIVTPAMHRVHHSQQHDETNSNFGNQLSIWDRLFGTYRAQAKQGDDITLGVINHKNATLWHMLKEPFVKD